MLEKVGHTHATMLAEDFDEVKGVEAEQQHQLVLTLSIITGSLWNTQYKNKGSARLKKTHMHQI